MAYDEELAGRIRELTAGEPALTEQKMFGGLAFLVGGNMAVAASGQGGLLVRVDPAESDALVESTGAELMEMRGRSMAGWLRVDAAARGRRPSSPPGSTAASPTRVRFRPSDRRNLEAWRRDGIRACLSGSRGAPCSRSPD